MVSTAWVAATGGWPGSTAADLMTPGPRHGMVDVDGDADGEPWPAGGGGTGSAAPGLAGAPPLLPLLPVPPVPELGLALAEGVGSGVAVSPPPKNFFTPSTKSFQPSTNGLPVPVDVADGVGVALGSVFCGAFSAPFAASAPVRVAVVVPGPVVRVPGRVVGTFVEEPGALARLVLPLRRHRRRFVHGHRLCRRRLRRLAHRCPRDGQRAADDAEEQPENEAAEVEADQRVNGDQRAE